MRKIPEDTVQSLFELRFEIENVFFRQFMKEYDLPSALNQTHMKAMMTVHFWGKQSMSDLSKKLNLEKGSFTPVANKLIEEGFLIKERSEKDKRVYILSLSEAGEKEASKFQRKHLKYVRKHLEQLSDQEAQRLDEEVISVIKVIDRFREGKKMPHKERFNERGIYDDANKL